MPILESVLTDAHFRGQIRLVFGPRTPNLPQMNFLDPDSDHSVQYLKMSYLLQIVFEKLFLDNVNQYKTK